MRGARLRGRRWRLRPPRGDDAPAARPPSAGPAALTRAARSLLLYPHGCETATHLSLFLCSSEHENKAPGWSHWAQFTVAAVHAGDALKSKHRRGCGGYARGGARRYSAARRGRPRATRTPPGASRALTPPRRPPQ